jgi:CRISPR/Cas system endoribonuclease Cas6 (RAMP superfamily)
VIADPDSAPPSTSPTPAQGEGVLSQAELYQLTLYKWRYSFEAFGFEHHQVKELMFLKWLHASRRLQP